ncbi:2-amino-3-ketobutyrate coenzyme A ligase [bioreactor metagenome]|uniref:2-amino-3-ketobutyrate coenzyme A ligase n=1 Tax=bioreactor metagenome TaxID=1076179 RepID=A0A645I9Q4_9ZZZZ
MRQRSRPYLFSNTLAPAVAAGSIKAIELIENDTFLRDKLFENTKLFASLISDIGLEAEFKGSPIIPIMLYDEHKAVKMARLMYESGVYVVAFSYPVVPKGKARIRTQMSAALSTDDIRFVVEKFKEAKAKM